MMNFKKLAHVLRAIGSVTGEKTLVVVGSTSVLLNAKNIPAQMLMSQEVDAFAPDVKTRNCTTILSMVPWARGQCSTAPLDIMEMACRRGPLACRVTGGAARGKWRFRA